MAGLSMVGEDERPGSCQPDPTASLSLQFWTTDEAIFEQYFTLSNLCSEILHTLSPLSCVHCVNSLHLTQVGSPNFLLGPQSQFRNLKEALPQSQFCSILKKCCPTTAIPQFCYHNFTVIRNLKSAKRLTLPQCFLIFLKKL